MLKDCRVCGKPFKIKPSHYDKRFTCSKECMAEEYHTRLQGESNPNYRNAGEHVCECCGKTFYSYEKERIFCSIKCSSSSARVRSLQSEAQKERQARIRRQLISPLEELVDKAFQSRLPFPSTPNYHIGRLRKLPCAACKRPFATSHGNRVFCEQCMYVTLDCIICGKSFTYHRSIREDGKRICCSDKCSRQWQSERQKGDGSHLWQGGKTDEARLFRNSREYGIWRSAVYIRDDYTCQLCFKKGGKLCAHHIKRFSVHRDLALLVENGITLCWPCHTNIRHKEALYEEQFYAITMGKKESLA